MHRSTGGVAALERLVQQLKLEKLAKVLAGSGSKKSTRRAREYTQEERAAIRARLLAGQEAAKKKRENENKGKLDAKTRREPKKVTNPKSTPDTKSDRLSAQIHGIPKGNRHTAEPFR